MPTGYTDKSEVYGKMPRAYVDAALLDSDPDVITPEEAEKERAENWAAIAESAAIEIDGYLGQQYSVPFSFSVPPPVRAASLLMILETLMQRRGADEESNIYTAPANRWRAKLDRMGRGDEPLTAGKPRAESSVEITSLPTRAHTNRINS